MMRGTMMDYPLTLRPLLERAGKYFPKVGIISRRPDRSLHRSNYGSMYRRAIALAEALQKAGLKRGDRVATLCWNHIEHLEAYFGVPLAGGVVHTLNLRLSRDELASIIIHAGDRFLIVDDLLLPQYQALREKVKLERVWVIPTNGNRVPSGYESYEDLLLQSTGEFHPPDLSENDGAAMCYTSGTTGMPKGVIYSHRALVLHTLGISLADNFGIAQRDVLLPVVPMYHANARGIPFAAAMIGAKLVFPGPYLDPPSLLELLESEQVTYAAGVPTVWMGVADLLEKHPGRWKISPRLLITSGGAATPESLFRRYDRLGIELRSSWGMTEMTPAGSTSRVKSTMARLPEDTKYAVRALAGLPFPLVEARAMSAEGEVPWDGQAMGELQVRGPWVAASYYNMEEAQGRWTDDGWFRTGDVVAIDPEGYIRIADRTKDLIKSGGEWISSVALENALMGHPAVKEAAVIAVPHPKWQERPLAVVVRRDGAQVTCAELLDHLAVNFAKWQLPEAIEFAESIPRTSVGKFQKSVLREKYKDWRWG